MPQRELLGQLVRSVLQGDRDKAKQIADSLVSIAERDGISGLALPLHAAAAGDLNSTSADNSDPIAEALVIIFRHYLDDTTEQSLAGDIGGFPGSRGPN